MFICTFKSIDVRMQQLIILIKMQISALSIPRVINDSEFGHSQSIVPSTVRGQTWPPGNRTANDTLLCVIMYDVNRVCRCDDDRWTEWVPLSRLAAFIFFLSDAVESFYDLERSRIFWIVLNWSDLKIWNWSFFSVNSLASWKFELLIIFGCGFYLFRNKWEPTKIQFRNSSLTV